MTLKPQSEVKLKPEIVNSENLVVPENRKNLAVNGGLPKKWIFLAPRPTQRCVFSFQRLFEFLILIRN